MAQINVGTYHGAGIGAPELGNVQNDKKTPYARVTLKVKGGEFDGKTASKDLFLSEAALPYSIKALRALGCTFPNNDVTNFDGYGSTDVSFTIEHKKYTTKDTNEERTIAEVGFINALGGGGIKPEAKMSDADKAALKARLLGTVAASAPKVNGTQAPKAGGTPPPF